jgi:hypothetical protein
VFVSEGFKRLKLHHMSEEQAEIVKQKSLKKVNEIQSELVCVIKKYDLAVARENELESEMQSTRKNVSDQHRYIKELETRSVQLNSEYIQALEQQNSGAA